MSLFDDNTIFLLDLPKLNPSPSTGLEKDFNNLAINNSDFMFKMQNFHYFTNGTNDIKVKGFFLEDNDSIFIVSKHIPNEPNFMNFNCSTPPPRVRQQSQISNTPIQELEYENRRKNTRDIGTNINISFERNIRRKLNFYE